PLRRRDGSADRLRAVWNARRRRGRDANPASALGDARLHDVVGLAGRDVGVADARLVGLARARMVARRPGAPARLTPRSGPSVRHGVRPLAPGSFLRLGNWYELHARPYQAVVYVENGSRAPAKGVQLLDRVRFTTGWGPEIVSLWVYRHGRGPRRGHQHAR